MNNKRNIAEGRTWPNVSADYEGYMKGLRRDENLPQALDLTLSPNDAGLWIEYNISGNFLYMSEAEDFTQVVDIRFDKPNNPIHHFTWGTRYYTPYNKLYIKHDNAVGDNTVRFIYGANAAIGKQLLDIVDFPALPQIAANTFPINPASGTQIYAYCNNAVNGVYTDIFTVPAGYTFYLTAAALGAGKSAAGSGYAFILIQDNVPVTQTHLLSCLFTGIDHLTVSLPFFKPIIIPSGYRIGTWNTAANMVNEGSITGYLIPV